MFLKITSLVQSAAQVCEMKLILFPALGLLAMANKRKYIVPKLHKKFYTGVNQVIDEIVSEHVRRRIIVMKAFKKGPAIITIHAHRSIRENFTVLRCDYPDHCYLLSLDGMGKIKKTSLREVGKNFIANPGDYHGFEVWKGVYIVKVEVERFKTNDIYDIEERVRLMVDLAQDMAA